MIVSGAIGLIALLQTFTAGLLSPPEASMVFSDVGDVNRSPDERVNLSLTMTNRSLLTSTDVKTITVTAMPLNGGPKMDLAVTQPGLLLPAGAPAQFLITGVTPKQIPANTVPLRYEVESDAIVHTGKWRGDGQLRTDSRSEPQIVVWPADIGWGRAEAAPDAASREDRRRFRATLYPGRDYPNGANGRVQISYKPNQVAEWYADCPSGRTCAFGPVSVSDPASSGRVTAGRDFKIPALEKFKPFSLAIEIDAPAPNSTQVWEELRTRIDVTAE